RGSKPTTSNGSSRATATGARRRFVAISRPSHWSRKRQFVSEKPGAVQVEPDGVHFEALRKSLDPSNAQATEAFRFVLVELLTVLGNLTDDIITPALHSALSKVAITGEKNPHGPPRNQEGEETPP
ncbi:MAG TPA: hypothetical protein VFF73_12165, partial [Planctomycetota bacterium]|nr:hypothetical protein [Planctomycetota bacterium]